MELDMAGKRVHRDSACRRVLMHARIRFHGDQHDAQVRVLHECPGTSPRGLKPGFVPAQFVEFAGQVKFEQWPAESALNRLVPDTGAPGGLCLGGSHTLSSVTGRRTRSLYRNTIRPSVYPRSEILRNRMSVRAVNGWNAQPSESPQEIAIPTSESQRLAASGCPR